MYSEWDTKGEMVDVIPLQRFEESIMSCTMEIFAGSRKELGKTYYYACIVLLLDGERYCRYALITKEEHDLAVKAHEGLAEATNITAQLYYEKYIKNHEIIYDGVYREDILAHGISVIREFNRRKHTVRDTDSEINAWSMIAGKEYKSSLIMFLIGSTLFLIVVVLKLVIPNPDYSLIWLNVTWLVAVAFECSVSVFFILAVTEKAKFLKSPKASDYGEEIRKNLWKYTPTEVITDKYIFKRRLPSKPIVLAEVAWVYHFHINMNNVRKNVIVFCMNDGKKWEIPYRASLTESDMYRWIGKQNPAVMIGRNMVNHKKYKDFVEFKKYKEKMKKS